MNSKRSKYKGHSFSCNHFWGIILKYLFYVYIYAFAMVKYFLHSHPIRDHVIMFMLQKANKWSTKPTKQRIEWVPVHFIWEDTSKEKSEKSRWVFNTSNVQRRSGNTSSYKVLKWINVWFRGKHNFIKNKN